MNEPAARTHPPYDLEKTGDAAPRESSEDGGVVLKNADRNDADEALKIFAEGEVITLTPEEEKRLLRKIDWNIMPLLCLVYGLNYLDKTTLSYASIMGLKVGLAIPPSPLVPHGSPPPAGSH